MKALLIKIDPALHHAMKVHCANIDITIRDYVTSLIENELNRLHDTRITQLPIKPSVKQETD